MEFLTADYEELNAAGAFDAVVFSDALHHAVDETAALRCAFAPKDMVAWRRLGAGFRHATSRAVEAMRKYKRDRKRDGFFAGEGCLRLEVGSASDFRCFRRRPDATATSIGGRSSRSLLAFSVSGARACARLASAHGNGAR